jgi:AraC-like DNA-binding protein/mannose-6-phosphate isomerase-like protein (cupin superfamily)
LFFQTYVPIIVDYVTKMTDKLIRSRSAIDLQHVPRIVTALAKEEAHGVTIAPHSHARAQFLYASEGVMQVSSEAGVWLIPPQRGLLIPPGVEHELSMLGKVSMRTLYIDAGAAQGFGPGCRVIEVSRLLRELILALVAEPVEYPLPGRGEHLAALILSEIAAAATVPIAIPWPRDRRLIGVCRAIMRQPGAQRTIEEWAGDAGASGRTLMRLFPKETGLRYRQWVQQVHLADAFCRLARGESIGEIARALGYASPSAFTTMFRRILGKTPQHYLTEWRQRAD